MKSGGSIEALLLWVAAPFNGSYKRGAEANNRRRPPCIILDRPSVISS